MDPLAVAIAFARAWNWGGTFKATGCVAHGAGMAGTAPLQCQRVMRSEVVPDATQRGCGPRVFRRKVT